MPSNKFAPLAFCQILVLLIAASPCAAGAPGFGMYEAAEARQSLIFGNERAVTDEKRTPSPSKRFQDGEPGTASVSGRVLTFNGTAISQVHVGLYNADLDRWFFAKTGTFGQYVFRGLPVSDFYVIVVIHKRYLFLDGSRTFTLEGDMFNVNFVASMPE